MTRGRVEKAAQHALHTQAEVHHLRPGLKFDAGELKVYTLEELQEEGFQLVPWDGMYVHFFSSGSTFSPNPYAEIPFPSSAETLKSLFCSPEDPPTSLTLRTSNPSNSPCTMPGKTSASPKTI